MKLEYMQNIKCSRNITKLRLGLKKRGIIYDIIYTKENLSKR